MREEKAIKISEIMKILSDPGRVQILNKLFDLRGGMCVNELADFINSSHSATSHQLAKLEIQGLVSSFREGQSIYYEIKDSLLSKKIKKVLKEFN